LRWLSAASLRSCTAREAPHATRADAAENHANDEASP
jgi:hypothetical protein